MITPKIIHNRLSNQKISQGGLKSPDMVVTWFGAMQAQDYAGVKWAIGLRCFAATEAAVEQAVVSKTIVRTWLMRGTLQMVTVVDLRWMLPLLAPRIITQSTRRYQQLELNEATFSRSFDALTKALQGNQQLTRSEAMLILNQAGISTNGQRGYHILRRAGLEGLLCLGGLKEMQETLILLDKFAPIVKDLNRDEAVAKLTERYLRSHGPATLQDFAWWSGLPIAEVRAGLEALKSRLHQEIIAGQTYWMLANTAESQDPSPSTYLLPGYDEYYLGYKIRDTLLYSQDVEKSVSRGGVFRPMIVIDGQIVGIWKQKSKDGMVIITPSFFNSLTEVENEAFLAAANRYGNYLGRPTVLA